MKKIGNIRIPGWGGGILLLVAAWFLFLSPLCSLKSVSGPIASPSSRSELERIVLPWREFSFPSPQQKLLRWEEGGVIQPTAAGRPESGLYGSVRTARVGRSLLPSFHEGIDIAPVFRDRRGQPTDPVQAVAWGKVAYLNRYSGNSNYGKYIVLLHPDPMGDVYTLYAHLASLSPQLKKGDEVVAGQSLGLMGNTSSGNGIPRARSHLHFEVGMVLNRNFSAWMKKRRLRNSHRNYNGWNLQGLDPIRFFASRLLGSSFSFLKFLSGYPRAFKILVRSDQLPDYFRRYPALWGGDRFAGGAMVLECSENGVILSGHRATPRERALLGQDPCLVLEVDPKVLGRNGARLIRRIDDGWELNKNGKQWLGILLWPQAI